MAWTCHACIESLNHIGAEWEHIYVRHSYRSDVDDVSLFPPYFPLREIFNGFIAELQEGNLQERIDSSHGSIRLVYHCRFNFFVGTFPDPNQRRRMGRIIHYATRFVKVVCASSECLSCGRRFPSWVITMYPH